MQSCGAVRPAARLCCCGRRAPLAASVRTHAATAQALGVEDKRQLTSSQATGGHPVQSQQELAAELPAWEASCPARVTLSCIL